MPKELPRPPGNTGTHIPAPNTYLLSQLTRTNYLTARKYPFTESGDSFSTELQRHVHHEGNRPPNRRILLFLRLLTFYPPAKDILPELITLLESDNDHICRLAHYHIRQLSPIYDLELYRQLLDSLERQATTTSPSRRACATKTYAKIFHHSEALHATNFILDIFNKIGGARVVKPTVKPKAPTKAVAGLSISKDEDKANKSKLGNIKNKAIASVAQRRIIRAGQVYDYKVLAKTGVDPDTITPKDSKSAKTSKQLIKKFEQDDGAGGLIQSSTAASATFLKSRQGKMLVGHCTIAALRRINRIATTNARVESYIFDSGLLSIVPSTVRHTIALLELRSKISPEAVMKYLTPRLPQKNPSPEIRLYFEDLGARVYFARLISALAEDPNLSRYIPEEAPKQANVNNNQRSKTVRDALGNETTVKGKATKLFKFLFDKQQIQNIVTDVRSKTSNALSLVTQDRLANNRHLIPKADDSLGVEFAQALVNLIKNSSLRVLLEVLKGLSRRKWTTWFESPVPDSALYNAPELQEENDDEDDVDRWDDDLDNESELNDVDSEDDNELGAYEDDIRGEEEDENNNNPNNRLSQTQEIDLSGNVKPKEPKAENETWISKLHSKRQKRREARIDTKTPFYLRKVGHGMVPALEVILRRINVALLHDEPIHRFAAVDAIIVLSRAKIYGHRKDDDMMYRRAQGNMDRLRNGASSKALIVVDEYGNNNDSFSDLNVSFGSLQNDHPFQALVKPLIELIDEDPSLFVRGRAAIALLFVVASGAGQSLSKEDDLDDGPRSSTSNLSEDRNENLKKFNSIPILLRYLGNYVRHPSTGSGVGFKQMSELVDYLVYEILDIQPNLSGSAVLLIEEWAKVHPTIGVCGRLGVIWEKILSLGYGSIVGKSLTRSIISAGPLLERVSSAAIIFLKRRILDIAVLSVNTSTMNNLNHGLPEPLPKDIGVEMERYFSILWYCIMLGPSAECRSFAVESLGGGAVLAGEPFRICVYERLVELVRIGGYGVRHVAERALSVLDTLYEVRESFSEERAKKGIPRNGKFKGKEWLQFVWQLRCRAVAAARIALGITPPVGWLPLGPAAVADIANAEAVFGDKEKQSNSDENATGSKAEPNGDTSAPADSNVGTSSLQENATSQDQEPKKTKRGEGIASNRNNPMGPIGPIGPLGPIGEVDERRDQPIQMDMDQLDERDRRGEYDERHNGRRGDDSYKREENRSREYDDDEYRGRDRYYDDRGDNHRDYDDRRDSRFGSNGRGHDDYRDDYRDDHRDDYRDDHRDDHRDDYRDNYGTDQEDEDRRLAERLQKEEKERGSKRPGKFDIGSSSSAIAGAADGLQKQLSTTAQAAERLLKQGVRGGKDLTDKVLKTAARSAALDKLRNINPRSKP